MREKGIDVKPPTPAKYLNEFRHGKDRTKDTSTPPEKTVPVSQKQEQPPQAALEKPIATKPLRGISTRPHTKVFRRHTGHSF